MAKTKALARAIKPSNGSGLNNFTFRNRIAPTSSTKTAAVINVGHHSWLTRLHADTLYAARSKKAFSPPPCVPVVEANTETQLHIPGYDRLIDQVAIVKVVIIIKTAIKDKLIFSFSFFSDTNPTRTKDVGTSVKLENLLATAKPAIVDKVRQTQAGIFL